MEKTRHYTEAGLIKKLEDYGIGRPSTYALLVDTKQDRGYVKKRDLIRSFLLLNVSTLKIIT